MARIKTAHLKQFLNEYHRDEISFSTMVLKLNEVANDPEEIKVMKRPVEPTPILHTFKQK